MANIFYAFWNFAKFNIFVAFSPQFPKSAATIEPKILTQKTNWGIKKGWIFSEFKVADGFKKKFA